DVLENLVVSAEGQVGENPTASLLRRSKVRRQERATFDEARRRVNEMGLSGREHSAAGQISLGEAKRVAIHRALQAGAKALFLDEPLAGLDSQGCDQIIKLLQT